MVGEGVEWYEQVAWEELLIVRCSKQHREEVSKCREQDGYQMSRSAEGNGEEIAYPQHFQYTWLECIACDINDIRLQRRDQHSETEL